jgi:ATP-binding cassette subfamily B protein
MTAQKLPKRLPAFVWRFVHQHLFKYCLGSFLIILSGVYPSIDGFMIKMIIDTLNALNAGLKAPIAPLVLILMYLAWGCFANFLWRLSSFFMLSAMSDLKANIIKEMSAYIITYGQCQGGRDSAGGISHRISEMATGVEKILQLLTESVLYTSCLILFSIGTLAAIHPLIAAVLISWFCAYVIISFFLQQHISSRAQSCSANRMSAIERLTDCITNSQCIKFFSRENYESQTLNTYLRSTAAEEKSLQRFSFFIRFSQDIIWVSFIAVTIGLLVKLQQTSAITIGDCALVLTLSQTIVNYSSSFTLDISQLAQTIGACKESLSLIAADLAQTYPSGTAPLSLTQGTIEFKDVSFGYTPNQPILKNQSITIQGGERIGLIGPSGSGKTTFINLLARLFDPQTGQILIDGQNIKEVEQESLREAMSIVPQVPYLFHRSIRENIAYGKLNASQDEIIHAARQAQAHDFIERLPFGYDTVIGEHDISLSYGQSQRIVLARVFIRDTPIVILDEATSALDGITELQIQRSLETFMQKRTTLVIVHKFSTLLLMDRIFVFQNGNIIENDHHDNLIQRPHGLYAELIKDQIIETSNKQNTKTTSFFSKSHSTPKPFTHPTT